MSAFISDVRWSLRLIRHRPAFAATVVFTLAGAVAAVTIALGVATAVLWRPLPFAHADRLAFVWENTGSSHATEPARVTGFRFDQWQRGSRALGSVALFGAVGYLADLGNGAVIVHGVRVSTNYFGTVGISPMLGRDFLPADGQPGAPNVVILSHALWREWLGGRADVIGTTVMLANRPFTVIGVMPPAIFPAWPENPASVTLDPESSRLWVPIAQSSLATNTRAHVYGVVARLADGRSMDDAAGELTSMAHASDPDVHGAVLRPFRDQFVHDARLPLIALIGAALAVLLVACTNIAALQGSAMESRRAELSVRAALGAGRVRLARQFVTEATILSAAGAAIGLLVSAAALTSVPSLLPPSVPLLTPPSLDARTLLAAAALALLAATMLSAWPLTRMMASTAPAPRGVAALVKSRALRSLVVAQVALAMALVASAALLQQSLNSVRLRPSGFVVDNVLVANVTLAGTAYNNSLDRVVAGERQITGDLARLPGTRGVAFAYDHPLEASWLDSYSLSGSAATRDDVRGSAQLRIVSPSYAATMGVQIVGGRDFAETDALGATGAALVNEAFAQRVTDGPVLNRTLHTGAPRGSTNDPRVPAEFRIVGIVENERFRGLERPSEPAVYLSTRQFPQLQLVMLMRTHADPESFATAARDTIRRFDPGVPVGTMTTLSAILAEQLVTRRATTHVIDGFAAGALGLAVLGLYGLLALLVASRTKETGIRLALGSSPAQEAGRVVRDSVTSTAFGVAGGAALSIVGGRLVESLLVGVSSRDVTTLVVVSGVMVAVAVASAALPAWRAARVDPATALRG